MMWVATALAGPGLAPAAEREPLIEAGLGPQVNPQGVGIAAEGRWSVGRLGYEARGWTAQPHVIWAGAVVRYTLGGDWFRIAPYVGVTNMPRTMEWVGDYRWLPWAGVTVQADVGHWVFDSAFNFVVRPRFYDGWYGLQDTTLYMMEHTISYVDENWRVGAGMGAEGVVAQARYGRRVWVEARLQHAWWQEDVRGVSVRMGMTVR